MPDKEQNILHHFRCLFFSLFRNDGMLCHSGGEEFKTSSLGLNRFFLKPS